MTRKSFGLSSFGNGLEDKGPTDLLVSRRASGFGGTFRNIDLHFGIYFLFLNRIKVVSQIARNLCKCSNLVRV